MPFIHEHNLLFVHIPKCGGTSVLKKFNISDNNLNACFRYEELKYFCEETNSDLIFSPQHFTPSLIKEYYGEFYKLYKKFTIVRNPYTRAISEYFFREQEVTEFNDKHFYEWWCKFTLSKCDHLLPQSTYFEDINYDFVLKFESLKRGFNKMCKDLNIPIGLPHINKSNLNSKSCLPLLSEKSKKFLYDIYIDDFTNFGYKSLL
tara:strand:- start:222 stop:833 length:612 start_codon:yes stop_codon:yes gene_type:complete